VHTFLARRSPLPQGLPASQFIHDA
jgi:hypothetical protein